MSRTLLNHGWKIVVLVALAVWLVAVGAHHEPWVDESQAWLIARDNSLVQLLIERVRYEGTPGLWHLILWLAIRAGLPFTSLYLVSVCCALGSAALLLWFAPFPAALRTLLACSYFGAYQYAVVARSYALDLVLVPALAALFGKRTERPILYGLLIGLLANCNAHSFLLAIVLGGEWLVAAIRTSLRKSWLGLMLAAGLGLFGLLTAWQPADNGFLHPDKQLPAMIAALRFIAEAFVDRLAFWWPPSLDGQILGIAVSLAVLAPAMALCRRARLAPLFVALVVVLIGFSAFGYANVWHSGMLFLVWIFGLWIAWPRSANVPSLRRIVIVTMTIVGGIQASEAARSGVWDLYRPYSGAAQAARGLAIWQTDHSTARLAVAGFKAFAVQPYFAGNRFANYHDGALKPSYIVWKRAEPWQPFAPLAEADHAIAGGYDALLLSPFGIAPTLLAHFEQQADARGYRVAAIYPGSLEWKGYAREDDRLIVFVRRSAQIP